MSCWLRIGVTLHFAPSVTGCVVAWLVSYEFSSQLVASCAFCYSMEIKKMIRGVVIIAALARPMSVIRAVRMQLIPKFWCILACYHCRSVTRILFEVPYNGPSLAFDSNSFFLPTPSAYFS